MLTAAETFTGPSLTDLIVLAREGQDTAPAAIVRMLHALESQLTGGPLADLGSGAVDGDGFVQEVQSLESSYEQNLDQQLSPEFPNVDEILKLAGQAIVADVISLNQQNTVGLISSSDLMTDAQTAIRSVTAGPILSLDTPLSGYAAATRAFEANLEDLVQSLSSTAATPVNPTDVSTTLLTEAEAYQADVHAGLEVTHPYISSDVDAAVDELENTASAIAQDDSSEAQSQLTSAISTFDAAILDTTGLFGPSGVISQAIAKHQILTPNLTVPQAPSAITSVSGTATAGGTATLTATLISQASGQGVSSELVDFTLDGAFAGQAMTNGDGVATLSGVVTSDAAGTDSGGIVASFAGDINYTPSHATGDLVVSPTATTLGSVSGTASFGGDATLTTTLTSSATNAGISGETVSFTLDGTSVGTAVTNSSGVATFTTSVATTDAVGTDTGGVVASFAGDTSYAAAANATGNLVVSQAATTLGSVSGTASFGGDATLTATLTSSVTSAGASGETVSFTLDGTSVGTAVTNSSGVATLTTSTATTDAVGTDTGGLVASFAGDANYAAAANATGNLVVSQAATTLGNVSGTATVGENATLTATLTSSVTSAGASGATVSFTLDGTSVGTAVTNSSGVATLTGVATSDAAGTDTGGVVASFAGNTDYLAASNATGNLVVTS